MCSRSWQHKLRAAAPGAGLWRPVILLGRQQDSEKSCRLFLNGFLHEKYVNKTNKCFSKCLTNWLLLGRCVAPVSPGWWWQLRYTGFHCAIRSEGTARTLRKVLSKVWDRNRAAFCRWRGSNTSGRSVDICNWDKRSQWSWFESLDT